MKNQVTLEELSILKDEFIGWLRDDIFPSKAFALMNDKEELERAWIILSSVYKASMGD